MKIQCTHCQHEGTVPDDKVPATGISVSCPKCKAKFQITPPTDSPPKADFYCPKCETRQPESDICIKCGIVFSKYLSALANQKPQKSEVEGLHLTIECHVCHAMISKNARSCPNCGEPYSFKIKPYIIKYRLLLVIVALIVSPGLLVWIYYYPNRINRMKYTISSNNSVESSTYKTEEVKLDPISIVDSCKAWKFEDGGYVPGIMFKVTNRLNNKINGIDFRAVWLKNGNEQFYTASTYLSNLDPNVTSQNVKLVPSKVKVISQSGRFNPVGDVEFLGKNLTVKVYYKVLFTGSGEKLIYDGPFNATFNETTPFF